MPRIESKPAVYAPMPKKAALPRLICPQYPPKMFHARDRVEKTKIRKKTLRTNEFFTNNGMIHNTKMADNV
jgi:hypothetical protein